MNLSSLGQLFVNQLKDLYNVETQLVKALPKMAKRASSSALRNAIESHLQQTESNVQRLQQIGEILDCKLTGQKCAAMKGLIQEGSEMVKADGDDVIIDAGIIAAAQRVEHYEIAAYGAARKMGELLGHQKVVDLLEQTLQEEKAADKKLTEVVEQDIYPQAVDIEHSENGGEQTGSHHAEHKAKAGHSKP
jgi:ferritin-like metal-binding protein YciE